MAKGQNAARHHRDFWSRRPFSGLPWGSKYKDLTHKAERRVEKRAVIARELADLDAPEPDPWNEEAEG